MGVPAEGGQARDEGRGPSFQSLYDELREVARRSMARESPGGTLQPTALVHEAYLKLYDQGANWKSDSQFLSLGAIAMRRILVDEARKRQSQKRGGGLPHIPLEEGVLSNERDVDVLAVDEALVELAALDERHAKIVEMRFFGGLTEAQMAEVLEISERTLRREWRICRAWLKQRLNTNPS
ncbi:MAG: ECF-type sigma factor [Bryobacterales bacterium]